MYLALQCKSINPHKYESVTKLLLSQEDLVWYLVYIHLKYSTC
jgi:hypothetical protein